MVEKILSIEIGNEWRGCLMVSVNSGSRIPGSSPGGSHCVAFNVPHSTQVYSRGNMRWTSILSLGPSHGVVEKVLTVSMNTGTSSGRMAKFGSNAEELKLGTCCTCNLTIMGIFPANRKACYSLQIFLSKEVNSLKISIAWNTTTLILPIGKLPSFAQVLNFSPMLPSSLLMSSRSSLIFSREDIHCKSNSTTITRLQRSRFFSKSVKRSVRGRVFQPFVCANLNTQKYGLFCRLNYNKKKVLRKFITSLAKNVQCLFNCVMQ